MLFVHVEEVGVSTLSTGSWITMASPTLTVKDGCKKYRGIFGILIYSPYICLVKQNTYTMGKAIDLSELVLRQEVSTRGGGVEIDLTRFGFKGQKMSAYQNYLGGGMLGKIAVNNTINAFGIECTVKQQEKLDKIGLRLKKYFFTLQYGEFDKEQFESNQNRAVSAY
jgi:hypothetical protein